MWLIKEFCELLVYTLVSICSEDRYHPIIFFKTTIFLKILVWLKNWNRLLFWLVVGGGIDHEIYIFVHEGWERERRGERWYAP